MEDMEIWKDIEGYEGLYQASNLGRVKAVPYGGKEIGKGKSRSGIVLKGDEGEYGKTRYRLYKNGSSVKYMGHILIAKTFPEICGAWSDECEVHHIDGNPSNNRADNLICLSHEEHCQIHKELGQKRGEKNPFFGKKHSENARRKNAKAHRKPIIQLTLDDVEVCYWFSVTDCERETGMNKSAINRVCLGKQNTAYGYKWCYASSNG